jgi:hypothetical protein
MLVRFVIPGLVPETHLSAHSGASRAMGPGPPPPRRQASAGMPAEIGDLRRLARFLPPHAVLPSPQPSPRRKGGAIGRLPFPSWPRRRPSVQVSEHAALQSGCSPRYGHALTLAWIPACAGMTFSAGGACEPIPARSLTRILLPPCPFGTQQLSGVDANLAPP